MNAGVVGGGRWGWRHWFSVGLVGWLAGTAAADEPREITDAARELHRGALLFDAHNNLIPALLRRKDTSIDSIDLKRFQQGLHTDLPRIREGGVGAEFFATYVAPDRVKKGQAVRDTLEQIEQIKRLMERFPDQWELATTSADIERLRAQGKMAGLIAIENGESIDGSLAVLRSYFQAGARCLALTHDDTHGWADAALDKSKHGGLGQFGAQVVAEMNKLGMVIDLSHASDETIHDVLELSRAPVVFSHSGARAIGPHTRNLSDDTLKAIAKNGGVVHVNFFSGYMTKKTIEAYQKRTKAAHELRKSFRSDEHYQLALQQWLKDNPLPATTVSDVVDHIEHIVKVAGVDHVGLGSNFDGIVSVPRDLNDVSCFPRLTQALLDRGFDSDSIRKILGENSLRVLRDVERAAAQSSEATAASQAARKESP